MNLNTLELDIEASQGVYEVEHHLIIEIDGAYLLDAIDTMSLAYYPELIKSVQGSGDYLIFTCACGVADCAGWEKVGVTHEEEIVAWDFSFNEITYAFRFDKNFNIGEIQRLVFEVELNKYEIEPKHVIEPMG